MTQTEISKEVFATIHPLISFSSTEKYLNASHQVFDRESVEEVLEFSICELGLDINANGILQVVLKPKAEGVLRVEGLRWNFLEVDFEHYFTNHKSANFNTFQVGKPAGRISASMEGASSTLAFGEVKEQRLVFKNEGVGSSVEEVLVFSEQPLFTGFSFKRLGRIAPGVSVELSLYLRATIFN